MPVFIYPLRQHPLQIMHIITQHHRHAQLLALKKLAIFIFNCEEVLNEQSSF